MKKNKIGILVLSIGIIALAYWFFYIKNKDKIEIITTEIPHIGSISSSVTATGKIQPVDTVAVGSQVSGTIKNVYVDFNSVVKKGQLLAEIDPILLASQVSQIKANLQQAKSNLAYQHLNFNRQKGLYEAGGISKADYETAQNALNIANDNVNSINAQLTGASKSLSFTKIFSPINGTVLSRKVSEGQTVASSLNTPTLFSIAKDLTKMQVEASVDEADIGNVNHNERAMFTVDAFPDDTFNGTVNEVRLHPTITSNVVTYTTIINAPNNNLKLKPGMTANITIYTKEVANAMLIPAKALSFMPDSISLKKYKVQSLFSKKRIHASKPNDVKAINQDTIGIKRETVWILNGNKLVEKEILIGINDGINVQVINGLTKTDAVITSVEIPQKNKNDKSKDKSPFVPQSPNRGARRM